MGRWVRAGQGSTASSRPTRVHLHARLSAGARVRVPCGRRPAWSRGGPSIALRVNTRGLIAPATAARGLRACARCPGLLCYSRQACLARPAGYSALPRIALQPGHTPPEPAACCARGRSPSADATRSWVSARAPVCNGKRLNLWEQTRKVGSHGDLGLVRRLRQPPLICRVCVCPVPSVRDSHMATFLQKLLVDWPTTSKCVSTETLRTCVLAELNSKETLPPGVLGRLCLKELVEKRRSAGYDTSIDNCWGRTVAKTGVGGLRTAKHFSASLVFCSD